MPRQATEAPMWQWDVSQCGVRLCDVWFGCGMCGMVGFKLWSELSG